MKIMDYRHAEEMRRLHYAYYNSELFDLPVDKRESDEALLIEPSSLLNKRLLEPITSQFLHSQLETIDSEVACQYQSEPVVLSVKRPTVDLELKLSNLTINSKAMNIKNDSKLDIEGTVIPSFYYPRGTPTDRNYTVSLKQCKYLFDHLILTEPTEDWFHSITAALDLPRYLNRILYQTLVEMDGVSFNNLYK
jgi:hypothetical protein